MLNIEFPDGSVRQFDDGITGAGIAADISKGLAKEAVAVKVNGEMWDLTREIEADATVEIVKRDTEDGLELLRHDAAHVLAEAVKEIWPETQVTIGPAIENGFYYDFAREEPFTPDDLVTIEARMKEIVERDETITREVWERDDAIKFFRDQGEEYKAQIIEDIPGRRNADAVPPGRLHRPVPRAALAINRQAWISVQADAGIRCLLARRCQERHAAAHLRHGLGQRQAAAKVPVDDRGSGETRSSSARQDHGPVSLPGRGARCRVLASARLEAVPESRSSTCASSRLRPAITKSTRPRSWTRSLWEASGHWQSFGEHMYTTDTEDGRNYAIKPMNCPGHVQVFKQGITSYRELPYRLVRVRQGASL